LWALRNVSFIQFSAPAYLYLLAPLLVFFWWTTTRSVTDMSAGKKRLALAIRCILATLIVFTVAGLRIVRAGESLAVVFLVDASRSIRDTERPVIEKYIADSARSMRPVDKVGVITFAQDPHTQSSPGQPLDPAHIRE